MNIVGRIIAGALALAMASPLAAQAERLGSSFAVIGPASPLDTEMVGGRVSSTFQLVVRPALAVTLGGSVPADVAAGFGAKADVPFSPGRQLYGWPERPGLFCDLLRSRGLGLSTACLLDEDRDGRFDIGLRLDFNSGSGEILGITPSKKIIGVRFTKVRVRLLAPVPYTATTPDPSVTGRVSLYFEKAAKKGPPVANLWLGTPDNYTGTEGLSHDILAFRTDKLPMDVDFYGMKVRLLDEDDKRAIRYKVVGVEEGATVPLLFRRYVMRMIGY